MTTARSRSRPDVPDGDAALPLSGGCRTRTDQVRLRLSDAIVKGLLPPGTTLDETELARRFEVSRTPVREAIRLLAASGLVEARPHRSAVVARPDGAALRAMFEALQELEALCAGLAAERATPDEIDALHDTNRRLSRIVRSGDPAAYHDANETFHHAVYAAAHNSYLADMTSATRARIAPFSRAQFHVRGRLSRSQTEHQGVIDAIRSGDRERAAREMRRHIATVHDSYRAFDSGGPVRRG